MTQTKHKFSKIAGILDLFTDPQSEDPSTNGNWNAAQGAFLPPAQQGQAPASVAQMQQAIKPPAPVAPPAVQFKAPTMPVNTNTPFKAPQIPGAGAQPQAGGPPMVSFNKQAAFNAGFQKRAQEYIN